jgi:predicted enzyme related to lactoylglutathione lyase
MAQRTAYIPGTFSWSDLSTTDQPAAKTFYSELFGWQADDQPMGDDAVYSLMKLDGQDAAAISPQPQQQRDAGVPPMWNSYVTVDSAVQTAERAAGLGATVHAPPFDVMDVGRMAVIQDPQGAFFLPWEPRRHIGAAVVNAPGALSWNELHTTDLDGAQRFYAELFGWTFSEFEGSPDPYFTIQRADGGTNGGITTGLQPGVPPHWLVYFGTDDAEQALSSLQELGGQKLMGPMSIGVGSIAVAQDPQGAVFALYGGQFED